MPLAPMGKLRSKLIWGLLALAVFLPLALSLTSPLLAWRSPIYIVAGLTGVLALGLLLAQSALAGGLLPAARQTVSMMHRLTGLLIIAFVIIHIMGLWITSPPDAIDALLLRSPAPFSKWGVIAFWSLLTTAAVTYLRRARKIKWSRWRYIHRGLAFVIAVTSAGHAVLVDGTMEPISKALLCLGLVGMTAFALWRTRAPKPSA